MSCTRIGNGIVCGPDAFVNLAPYGAKVWMEWHNYMGPVFFRSQNMIAEIQNPSRKTWKAFEAWQKDDWHNKYMARIMERTKCDADFAKATLEAGMDNFDYTDDPKDAADEELSYWTD